MLINKMHICIISDYIHKFAPHANMLLMSSSQTSAQPHSESQLRLSLQAELSLPNRSLNIMICVPPISE